MVATRDKAVRDIYNSFLVEILDAGSGSYGRLSHCKALGFLRTQFILNDKLRKFLVIEPLLKTSVVSILNLVTSTHGHLLGYLGPARTILEKELHHLKVLSIGPLPLVDIWTQLELPALATLFGNASRKFQTDLIPEFWTINSHQGFELEVISLSPLFILNVNQVTKLQIAILGFFL